MEATSQLPTMPNENQPKAPAAPMPKHVKNLVQNSLEYFRSIPVDDQIELLTNLKVDALDFSEKLKEHKIAALGNIQSAIESIKQSRPATKSSKSDQLRLMFKAEVMKLVEAEITAKEIVGYLKERHKFTVKEPMVKQLIDDIKKDELLKNQEICKEIEKYQDWTNQQLANHINVKFAIKTTVPVLKLVRSKLSTKK